jgi:hypothetical protein
MENPKPEEIQGVKEKKRTVRRGFEESQRRRSGHLAET